MPASALTGLKAALGHGWASVVAQKVSLLLAGPLPFHAPTASMRRLAPIPVGVPGLCLPYGIRAHSAHCRGRPRVGVLCSKANVQVAPFTM